MNAGVTRKPDDSGTWIAATLWCVTASGIATQHVAKQLGYNPDLGAPLWRGIYAPWGWSVWAWQFSGFAGRSYEPAVTALVRTAIVAGLKFGALVAIPVVLVAMLILSLLFRPAAGRVIRRVRGKGHVSICIGTATGKLWEMGDKAGLKREKKVWISDDDLSADLICIAAKGTGKTTSFQVPILLQALQQNCGCLVWNVKGDFEETVRNLAARVGRKVRTIGMGDGAQRVNLFAGLSVEMAATYLQSLLLIGDKSDKSKVWSTSAVNLSRGVLGLLWYIPGAYSLPGLYRYVFVESFRDDVNIQIAQQYSSMGASDRRNVDTALQEVTNYFNLPHETLSSIRMQLSQVLSKTVAPEIEDAFFAQAEAVELDLPSLYRDGAVIVVNASLQRYDVSARACMTLLKLRAQDVMEERRVLKGVNKTRRVGFFADEVHEIATGSVDGRSDWKFGAVSRDTRTFSVASTQSLPALDAAITPDMRRAFMANYRQRIYGPSEDESTIKDALFLLGQTERARESKTESTQPGKSGKSRGTSTSTSQQPIAHAEIFSNLEEREMLFIGTVAGRRVHSIIRTSQIFTQKKV